MSSRSYGRARCVGATWRKGPLKEPPDDVMDFKYSRRPKIERSNSYAVIQFAQATRTTEERANLRPSSVADLCLRADPIQDGLSDTEFQKGYNGLFRRFRQRELSPCSSLKMSDVPCLIGEVLTPHKDAPTSSQDALSAINRT